MKATQKQIDEWKQKYGNIFLVQTETGLTAYLSDPMSKLVIIKALMAALEKGTFEFVETYLANCWIDGDEEIKKDDKIKAGLWDQVKDIIDIPDHSVEFSNDKAVITVEGKSITLKIATRQEIKYADDRNKAGKPLDSQIYLLEKIANAEELASWKHDTRLYVGLLTAIDKVKARVHVSIKKL